MAFTAIVKPAWKGMLPIGWIVSNFIYKLPTYPHLILMCAPSFCNNLHWESSVWAGFSEFCLGKCNSSLQGINMKTFLQTIKLQCPVSLISASCQKFLLVQGEQHFVLGTDPKVLHPCVGEHHLFKFYHCPARKEKSSGNLGLTHSKHAQPCWHLRRPQAFSYFTYHSGQNMINTFALCS